MNGTDVELARIAAGERFAGTLLVSEVEHRSYGDGKDCIVLTLANGGLANAASLRRGRRALLDSDRRLARRHRGRATPPRDRPLLRRPGIPGAIRAVPASTIGTPRRARRVAPTHLRGRFDRTGHRERARGRRGSGSRRSAAPRHRQAGAYRWTGPFEITEQGALLGHVALGLLMFERRLAAEAPPCSPRELMLLQHLIASHHGRLEFGATVPPMTLEAEILHSADDASARSASMALALEDNDNFPGDALVSARGVWRVDRRKEYRGRSDWGKRRTAA